MSKQLIKTALAPQAIGPFAQANIQNNFLFTSSQNGALPIDGSLPDDFESQMKNAMYNLKAVVEAAGSRLDRIVRTSIFLTDMDNFDKMNEIYGQFFRDDNALPAREIVGVHSLPQNALVAVSAVAYVRDDT